MPDSRRELGTRGEQAAAEWYRSAGYEVVAANWRCRDGEIDLVVRRGRLLVICEVKTRTTTAFGTPAEAVTRAKQQRLRHLARRYLTESGVRYRGVRFDVVAIVGDHLEVIEDAF